MTDDKSKQHFQQRRYQRKNIQTDVTYYYQNDRLNRIYTGTGRSVNLSMNGALIRIENYLPPHSEIDVVIMKGGLRVTTRSRVIHCHRVSFSTYEVGIQFLDVKKG